MRKMKRILSPLAALLCMALLLAATPALAEDCFTLNVDVLDMDSLNSDEYVSQYLSAQTQGIRVKKYISDSSELAAPVRLTLMQMDSNSLLFDKDYGYQSGTFDSGVIYLPYVDDRTIPYLVTLYVADYVYAMPFMHLQPRLTYNGACTYGIRLRDVNPALTADWLMGTMVDLNSLRSQGSQVVDVCASNRYIIGQATLVMQGDAIKVSLAFFTSANVAVNYISLFVITNCASFTMADVQRISQPAHVIDEWVDVTGASSALIYLPMQVSYDPAGLSAFEYSTANTDIQNQMALWQQNLYGADAATEALPTDDWSTGNGWDDNSGWDDNAGWDSSYGWDDNSGWDDNAGSDDTSGLDDTVNSADQDSFMITPDGY